MKPPREVSRGIHLLNLPLPFELQQINTYLVPLQDGWLLIDAGIATEECFEALSSSLDSLAVRFTDIRQLLLTHFHPDHMGLAPRLLALTGAGLLMHSSDVEQLDQLVVRFRRSAWIETLYREAGIPAELQDRMRLSAEEIDKNFTPLKPDRMLQGGETLETAAGPLDVVWTPGHSPGHICLHGRERRLLFSGDHILDGITPNISWYPERDTLGEFLESLDAVARLDVDLILPSHGAPFSGHVRWVEDTKRHHDERCGLILDSVRPAPRTAFDLVGALWQKRLSPFHVRFAVFEVLAHLEYMKRRGRVQDRRDDGVVRWSPG